MKDEKRDEAMKKGADGEAAAPADHAPKDEPGEAELKEKLIRLAAEFDNYKKRSAREATESRELGKAELLKSMLSIMDEFDLMLVSASRSEDRALSKGIELLYANFMDAMRKNGLREIECSGPFDPYKHEIMMVREAEGREDGHIVEVIKKGYMLNDRMIRPASVIVARKQNPAQESAGNEKEEGKDEGYPRFTSFF